MNNSKILSSYFVSFDKREVFLSHPQMFISILLILLHGITSNDHSTPVRRGNVFQQLGFLAGIPLNEQYYSMLLHIMYEESLKIISE